MGHGIVGLFTLNFNFRSGQKWSWKNKRVSQPVNSPCNLQIWDIKSDQEKYANSAITKALEDIAESILSVI
jgi:hypothetical protein